MKFEEWEVRSQECMKPDLPLTCKALGLGGEAGEVQELIKKKFRGDENPNFHSLLVKELGDTLWYIKALANHYDIPMSDVFEKNVEKLESRSKRDVINGSGDNR